MQTQRQAGAAAGFEVPARMLHAERAFLHEHVCREGDPGRLGQHLGQSEVEVLVGLVELRRHRVGAEPRRTSTGVANRT